MPQYDDRRYYLEEPRGQRSISGSAESTSGYVGDPRIHRELTGEPDPATQVEQPQPPTIENRQVHSVLRVAPSLRASTEYREQAKARLIEAHSDGRITDAVFQARINAVDNADTMKQIEALMLDLPAPPAPEPEKEPGKKRPSWRNPVALINWLTGYFGGDHWQRRVMLSAASFAICAGLAVVTAITFGGVHHPSPGRLAVAIGGGVFFGLAAVISLVMALSMWLDEL